MADVIASTCIDVKDGACQEACPVLCRWLRNLRDSESSRSYRVAFQRRVQNLNISLGTRQRTKAERFVVCGGQRHPFPASREDEITGRKVDAHGAVTNNPASSAGGASLGTLGKSTTAYPKASAEPFT